MNRQPEEGKTRGELGRVVVRGASVTLLSYVLSRVLNLLVTILLARFLQPQGMGVVAAAILVVELIDMLRDFGLREAIIYNKDASPEVPNTGFLLFLGVGGLQMAAVLAVAPFMTNFVEDARIVPVLGWLSLLFPINTLAAIQDAQLQKTFAFGKLAKVEIWSVAIKAVVAGLMLMTGFGIWSFVVAMLASRLARTVMLWRASDWRPTVGRASRNAIRFLIVYGSHIVYTSVLFVLRARSDQMAILYAMGDTALGLYYMAARMPEIAIAGISSALTRVIFPALTRVADDTDRLRQVYLNTVAASMALMAPISFGLAAVAHLIVPVLFGPSWSDAAPVMVILALTGIPVTLGWTAGDVFKAIGRPQLQSKLAVIEAGMALPLIWTTALVSGSIVPVALAMLAVEIATTALRLNFASRHADIGAMKTLRAVFTPILAAGVMFVAVFWASQTVFGGFGDVFALIASIALGVVVYPLVLFAIDAERIHTMLSIVKR